MVDKTYAIQVRYTHDSMPMENRLHFRKITVGDPTAADLLAVANDWKEVVRPSQVNKVTYVDYVATQVLGSGVTYNATNCRQVGGVILGSALTGTLIGTDGTDPLPPMASMSVALRTGLRGRSYVGRVQLGSFSEGGQTNGTWGNTLVSAIESALTTFVNKYAEGGSSTDWRWVVFSRGIASGCFPDQTQRHHPLVHRQSGNEADSIHNVTQVQVNTRVTTTRSRLY